MNNEKIANFLKLSKREARVFEYLKEFPGSQVAAVSKSLKLPRMSTYLLLKSLKRRGLVDYHRKGARKYWEAVKDSKFVEEIIRAVHSLTETREIRVRAQNSGFAIHQGLAGIYKVWQEFQNLAPNSRIQAIQPTGAMKYALNKLEWQEKIAPLQENILKKPIIVDGIIPEDYYPFLLKHFEHDKDQQRKMLESFLGRATDITFVSTEYFKNAESELMILPHVAYLSDWKNEVSVEIKNPSMLTFLREMYELTKGYGRKVNQEQYIKELIRKLDQ